MLRPRCVPRAGEGARKAAPADPFVILLKGLYQPVVHGPNLGLSTVDLSDGSYSTTKIYPVSGTPGNKNPNKAIGDFYVQFAGDLCAYHIPGGSFAMRFTGSDAVVVADGAGGTSCRNLRADDPGGDRDLSSPSSAATTTWWTTCISSPLATPTNTASATSAVHKTTVVT